MVNRETILVVDDSEDARSCVAEVLRDEGFATASVPDGRSALQLLARYPADLVLADYRMPGMDGIELIRQIRKCMPDQCVLLMTAFGDKSEAPGYGLTRCVRKPIDIDDLVWMIDCTLATRSGGPGPTAHPAGGP